MAKTETYEDLAKKIKALEKEKGEWRQKEKTFKTILDYFQLHSDMTNTFMRLSQGEFHKTIEQFLRRIVDLIGVDRGTLLYWPEGDSSTREIYAWKKEGIKSTRGQVFYDRYAHLFTYLADRLRKGLVFQFSNVDDLPDEAQPEKDYFRAEGTKSAIRIPMLVEDRLLGVLLFDSYSRPKTWPSDLVKYLQIIIQTFTYSLEMKRAGDALRESEDKLRAIFENVNDEIVYMDEQGTVIDVNKRVEDIFGFKPEEAIGKKFNEVPFCQPDNMDSIMELFFNGFSGNIRNLTEFTGKRKDGAEVLVEASTSFVSKDGGIKNIISVIRDITERKKLESQLQQAKRMEAIGTLAGGIAHDFNNLLMGIQGRTSMMLMDSSSSHPHFEHLRGIETYVKNAADLTKQLLGFARGGKYEVRPTDLNELIDEQNQMFGRTKKEITIRGKYGKDLWSAEVDRGQIQQVLLNLYVNAWQSMPGGGDLYIQTENVILDEINTKPLQLEPGRYIKISVTDTGVGMNEATCQRIFDPFFTTKQMGRGTGLGLASAYGIIKNHSGIINVYSEEGQGTTFNIYLPATEKVEKTELSFSEEVIRGSETILLVDDEEMIIDVGRGLLQELGYMVLSAGSGKEAIETYAVNKDQIALVILDMIMPNMGGGAVYEKLKEMNPGIKVLLSSGYSINGMATEILELGCDGFIQKPFSIVELSEKIKEVLEKQ